MAMFYEFLEYEGYVDRTRFILLESDISAGIRTMMKVRCENSYLSMK